jgi:hypothetical protein
MRETRREFLASAAVLGSCLAVGERLLGAQSAQTKAQEQRQNMPKPQQPVNGPPGQDQDDTQGANPQSAKKAQLLQNEKEFRAGVERLYELSGELREEVQKTPTTDVLSLRMYKKTEEIEKLAKQLKGKAKG